MFWKGVWMFWLDVGGYVLWMIRNGGRWESATGGKT